MPEKNEWGEDRNNFWGAQKLFSSNLRVKTYKKKGLGRKICEKTVLAHEFRGEDQSFETVAPSLLLCFGAQSSLGGVTSSDLGGDTASKCPQWGRACPNYFTIKKAFNPNFEKRKKILKKFTNKTPLQFLQLISKDGSTVQNVQNLRTTYLAPSSVSYFSSIFEAYRSLPSIDLVKQIYASGIFYV